MVETVEDGRSEEVEELGLCWFLQSEVELLSAVHWSARPSRGYWELFLFHWALTFGFQAVSANSGKCDSAS